MGLTLENLKGERAIRLPPVHRLTERDIREGHEAYEDADFHKALIAALRWLNRILSDDDPYLDDYRKSVMRRHLKTINRDRTRVIWKNIALNAEILNIKNKHRHAKDLHQKLKNKYCRPDSGSEKAKAGPHEMHIDEAREYLGYSDIRSIYDLINTGRLVQTSRGCIARKSVEAQKERNEKKDYEIHNRDAAEMIGVAVPRIHVLVKQGKIRKTRRGFVMLEDVQAYGKRKRSEPVRGLDE